MPKIITLDRETIMQNIDSFNSVKQCPLAVAISQALDKVMEVYYDWRNEFYVCASEEEKYNRIVLSEEAQEWHKQVDELYETYYYEEIEMCDDAQGEEPMGFKNWLMSAYSRSDAQLKYDIFAPVHFTIDYDAG